MLDESLDHAKRLTTSIKESIREDFNDLVKDLYNAAQRYGMQLTKKQAQKLVHIMSNIALNTIFHSKNPIPKVPA